MEPGTEPKKRRTKSFIEKELIFVESKLKELKKYIADNPFGSMKDRVVRLAGPRGSSDKVVATKEAQRKDISAALKDYTETLTIVEKLRTENKKQELLARGGNENLSLAEQELLKSSSGTPTED